MIFGNPASDLPAPTGGQRLGFLCWGLRCEAHLNPGGEIVSWEATEVDDPVMVEDCLLDQGSLLENWSGGDLAQGDVVPEEIRIALREDDFDVFFLDAADEQRP